ncbi:unnamed protein product [Rodentolepis nana]|uniref:Secreted protein n=1 Tax=Rodentolepis nana TaxID=102285 RepID=A0A0R3TYJ8_RODNA|nr:unnamed protein product [Rodentolepis nana]
MAGFQLTNSSSLAVFLLPNISGFPSLSLGLDSESGGSSVFPPVSYIEGMWVEYILPICEDVLPSNRVRYVV